MSLMWSSISSPWTLLGSQLIITSFVLGFTKPSSALRPLLLIPVLLATLVYIPTARHRVDNIFQVSWGASQAVLATYQYIDVALITRWDFDFSGPEPKEPTKRAPSPYAVDTVWNRLKFGLYATSSFRNCATAFETRGLRPFRRSDPKYTPSTDQFVISATLHLIACYLVLDALTSLGEPDKQAVLFAESRIPLLSRLGDVSAQELMERLICSFVFWLVNYLVLSTSVTAISLIMVSTGISEVSWWKPLFNFDNGFPFTIRRFWSHFWHLSVKNRIYGPSIYITEKILKLPRGSLATQYTILLLTFVFSTSFHALGDIACGIPPSKTGAPLFFGVQAIAIILEDLVQYTWKCFFSYQDAQVSEKEKKQIHKGPARWQVWVGRLWVFLFMYWCTPFYAYPVTAHNGDGLIVPFSVMRRVFLLK